MPKRSSLTHHADSHANTSSLENPLAALWEDPAVAYSPTEGGGRRPAARMEAMRAWFRKELNQKIASAGFSEVSDWMGLLQERCARTLAADLERTRHVILEQRQTWSNLCQRASFGPPGLWARMGILALWFKCRSETRNLEASRLRLASLKGAAQNLLDHCRNLSTVLICLLGNSGSKDSASAPHGSQHATHEVLKLRRIDKWVKLESERLITRAMLDHGKRLETEQMTLRELTQHKQMRVRAAMQALVTEQVRSARLRRDFENKTQVRGFRATERLLHSGFVTCARDVEGEYSEAVNRHQILQNEYHSLQKMFLAKVERLGRYVDLSADMAQEHESLKGTENEARRPTKLSLSRTL